MSNETCLSQEFSLKSLIFSALFNVIGIREFSSLGYFDSSLTFLIAGPQDWLTELPSLAVVT